MLSFRTQGRVIVVIDVVKKDRYDLKFLNLSFLAPSVTMVSSFLTSAEARECLETSIRKTQHPANALDIISGYLSPLIFLSLPFS